MTSEQPPPSDSAEQPDSPATGPAATRGAVPADDQQARADRDGTPPQHPAASTVSEAPAYREVSIRRAPKIIPFMALGAVLGFLAALVVTYTGPVDPTLTRGSVLGFFTVTFAVPGLILAGVIVLVIDRRSVRKAERARAERTFDDDA